MLLVIAKAPHAVFVPAISAAAGMVVGEIVPGVAVCAVVFAHRAPGALAEIGTPTLPIGFAGLVFRQTIFLRIANHGSQ